MKVLVTGAKGQLGYDVMNELVKRGHTAIGADITDFDITDAEMTDAFFNSLRPDAVIHCAAWTAVDLAETEAEKCTLVNKTGTENIVNSCKNTGAKLLYLSTDYVFDGTAHIPYTEEEPTCPASV